MGRTAPDAEGVGTATARFRAERVGGGNGRVDHVAFSADDGSGGSCFGEVRVSVPGDLRRAGVTVDEGPLDDSTATAP